MPAALDIRSLIAMASVMALLMAVLLFFMRRSYPAHIRGLDYWAATPALWMVASVLFASRGSIPPWLSVLGANVLLMLSTICYHAGCRRFFNRQPRWKFWLVYLVLGSLVLAWLTFAAPNYAARVVAFTGLMMFIYGANLLFLLRHGDKRLPVRLVQIVLGVQLAVMSVRLVTAAQGLAGEGLLETSPLQTAYIGAFVLTVLMLSIGAVLMATGRLVSELELLATQDPLTHTLNRRALLQCFDDELLRCERSGKGPSLLMLDLDHFKTINDTRGHQHGDAVLVHFAQRTQAVLRGADRLGRYGGEEFTVLLPETCARDALQVAKRIHAAVATGHALDCQLSIGLATWQGAQDTRDKLLARADTALYQAKELGRNQTCTA